MEYEGNRPIRVLLPDQLQSYSLTGNGDFPRLSKAEITDKSKGDFISKAVIILQTGWFVLQCIARRFQGLQTTELELVTVAFATINFYIYVMWFEKPLDVQCGVRVYKRRKTEQSMDSDDGTVEDTAGFLVALGDALSNLPSVIVKGPSTDVSNPQLSWSRRVFGWPFIKTQQILGIAVSYPGSANLEKRVGTFYPETWEGSRTLGLFAATLVALAFGSIHCAGLSFYIFPSSLEQTLWRVASVSTAGIPIILFLWLHPLFWVKARYPEHRALYFFALHLTLTSLRLFSLSSGVASTPFPVSQISPAYGLSCCTLGFIRPTHIIYVLPKLSLSSLYSPPLQ